MLACVFPSTQWCSIFCAVRVDLTYVEMHDAGALCTHLSCTVYLHTKWKARMRNESDSEHTTEQKEVDCLLTGATESLSAHPG